jgi:hypothetical protein
MGLENPPRSTRVQTTAYLVSMRVRPSGLQQHNKSSQKAQQAQFWLDSRVP